MAWSLRFGSATVEYAILVLVGLMLVAWIAKVIPAGLSRDGQAFPRVPEAEMIKSCMAKSTGPSSRILITYATLAARLSAVHGMRTSFLPINFSRKPQVESDLTLFLHTFDVGYLGGDATLIEQIFPSALRQRVSGDCGVAVYRVLNSTRYG
jgi:hypothetical protein